MPRCKNTIKTDEVATFFKKSTKEAMRVIYEVIKATKTTDCGLGLTSACNVVRKTAEKLLLLLLYHLFKVTNPYNFPGSRLAQQLPAGKDQFYRLLNDGGVAWRTVGHKVFGRLKKLLESRSEASGPTCLIANDSDLPKTGRRMELLGKVFSHVSHSMILGFKMLTLAYSDGKTLLPVDFSLHGEKGKNGTYGMKSKDLKKKAQDKLPALHESGSFFRTGLQDLCNLLVYRCLLQGRKTASEPRRMSIVRLQLPNCSRHHRPVAVQHSVGGQALRELRDLRRIVPRHRGRRA